MKTGVLTLERLVDLMSLQPRQRFNLDGGVMKNGQIADLTLIDLEKTWTIDSNDFVSLGKATPFDGWQVQGDVLMTMVDGNIVYRNEVLDALVIKA